MKRLNYFEISKIELDLKAFSIKGSRHDSLNISGILLSRIGSLVSRKNIRILMLLKISSDICFLFSIYSIVFHFTLLLFRLSDPYPIPFFFLFIYFSERGFASPGLFPSFYFSLSDSYSGYSSIDFLIVSFEATASLFRTTFNKS